MMISDVAVVEFVSASTKGVVNVQLGFIPDAAILISDHGGTPIFYWWINNTKFTNFAATLSIKDAGTPARDTNTVFSPYTGAEKISADQTANSAPKHVDRTGAFALAGRITQPGLAIAGAGQVNSGRNVLIAIRLDT